MVVARPVSAPVKIETDLSGTRATKRNRVICGINLLSPTVYRVYIINR